MILFSSMRRYITKIKEWALRPLKIRIVKHQLEEFREREMNSAEIYRYTHTALPFAIRVIEEHPLESTGIGYTVPLKANAYEGTRICQCLIYHGGLNKFNLYVGEDNRKPDLMLENAPIENILRHILFSPFLNIQTARNFMQDLSKRTAVN